MVKITTSTKTPDAEQLRRINDVVDRLVREQGYCTVCANELLKYVGTLLNADAVLDAPREPGRVPTFRRGVHWQGDGYDVSLSQHDWSLHRKGPIDQARHNEKVKEAIKENLADIVGEESIITVRRQEGRQGADPLAGAAALPVRPRQAASTSGRATATRRSAT